MRVERLATIAALVLTAGSAGAAEIHHVHLNAVDPAAAATWYVENIGGERQSFRGRWEMVSFGNVRLVWAPRPSPPEGSEGSSIDHLAFSFADLDTRVERLRAAGIDVHATASAPSGEPALHIFDPSGTKLELLEDAAHAGLHHVHLRGPDPQQMLRWFCNAFGGEVGTYAGAVSGVRYGDVWLLASEAPLQAATLNRAIDHVSWGFWDIDEAAAELATRGVTFKPMSFQETRVAFSTGPHGVRVELVHLRSDAEGASAKQR
jgi:catechol 2,3-dioxygenase-like lactoylglutathione lyase family enzyme